MMYSTRKFRRILTIVILIVLLAGKVPWGAITAKWGLWRMELQTGRIGYRIGETLQRALDRIDSGIRNWGK